MGVRPLTPEYQSMEKVSIVDAKVQYTCQYTENLYVLLFRNALSVPRMDNNLTLTLITREACLKVKDTAKFHAIDPSVEYNSIYFPNFDIHIRLFLNGVFSYFRKSKPSLEKIEGEDEIYLMTLEGR